MDNMNTYIADMLSELVVTHCLDKQEISRVTGTSVSHLNQLLEAPSFVLKEEQEAHIARLYQRLDQYDRHQAEKRWLDTKNTPPMDGPCACPNEEK